MSISSTEKANIDSFLVLSLAEYKAVIDEDSSVSKEYSKVGHLYPEKNTPQLKWFKGSRNRGISEVLDA